jgi:hypothetical protein
MRPVDPGIAYLNGLLDERFLAEVRRDARRLGYLDEAEMDPAEEEQSSAASGRAQDQYEAELIEEARAIVSGASKAPPSVEHLRVLTARLSRPEIADGSPF